MDDADVVRAVVLIEPPSATPASLALISEQARFAAVALDAAPVAANATTADVSTSRRTILRLRDGNSFTAGFGLPSERNAKPGDRPKGLSGNPRNRGWRLRRGAGRQPRSCPGAEPARRASPASGLA